MSAPKARAVVRTATGGLLLRLIGLAALAALWLVLSATRADADVTLPPLPGDTVSDVVDAVPVPEPVTPVVDQAAAAVDDTVETAVDATVEATGQATGQADEAVRTVRDDVNDVNDAVGRTVAPTPTSPGARPPAPAPTTPVEDAGSPVLPGDPRSSHAARHRSGRPVDRGATGVARAVDGPAPARVHSTPWVARGGVDAATGPADRLQAPPLPLRLPLPLQPAPLRAASAPAGALGPGQQPLVVAALAAALLLVVGSSGRVAVLRRRRPHPLTLRPATSPD
ncbi:hypothetical protein [Nocardioides iriomotensis]|uniref:Uncharacterized protein n=1 Tax=Nocardioides iriomotensis TaxID=715784 RepID=A0A4Q5J2X9_9ACTN|nr:hypothetical protein [Nocardioides iriomotensis]RYU12957.1 hypothetical protein ETU37_08385 [Nocardioides iriomotensis]